jgi:hypothetical protein
MIKILAVLVTILVGVIIGVPVIVILLDKKEI